MNADELARVLNELCVEFGIRANSLLAAMRDGASVNQAALNRIQFFFPKMLNIVCFFHTLDNVGNHLMIPTLQLHLRPLLTRNLPQNTSLSIDKVTLWSASYSACVVYTKTSNSSH